MAAPDPLKPARIPPEEYLRLEALAEERHEYVAGARRLLHPVDSVTGMAGSSAAHIRIVRNLGALLPERLPRSCENFGSDVKVRFTDPERYYYPDATIICDPRWTSETDGVLENPLVLFEVLSPSTQTRDRGEKVEAYLTLASVQAIVLISSVVRKIEIYERQDASRWLYQVVDEPGAILHLGCVGVDLAADDLYDRVELASTRS